jgi:hypothetical protein
MTTQTVTIKPQAGHRIWICALALAGCAGSVESGANDSVAVSEAALAQACVPDVPPELTVPDGNRLAFHLKGVGAQVYACSTTATGYGWVFQAPDADLLFPNGWVAGSHYAGPTWEVLDGSTVVGKKVAGVTVDPTAVPWLLLSAVSHTGKGAMSNVSFIQRLSTTGGLAPTSACGADNLGEVANVPYTAQYYFFVPKPAQGSK